MTNVEHILNEMKIAREKALAKGNGKEDLAHSANDWVAFINAYTGRAARGVYRNDAEGQDFRSNMVKAGGLILSAIAAYDTQAGVPK